MKKNILTPLSLVFIGLISFTGCVRDGICMKGDGNKKEKQISTDDFHKVKLEGSMNVFITEGPHSLTLKGDKNIMDEMNIRVKNNQCKIDLKNGCFKNFDMEVHITMPELTEIDLDGSGNIDVRELTNQKHMNVVIDGSGDVLFDEIAGLTDLDIEINGSGNVDVDQTITGVENVNVDIRGSGSASCFLVETEKSTVNIDGSGDCDVFVSDELNANINGSGDINYKGNPTIHSRIDGSGSVRNKN